MEEYRMLSGFKPKDIDRIYTSFYKFTMGNELLSKEVFINIEAIKNNPLIDRIALCFGFDEERTALDFQAYLTGLALFNSPGQREQKMKTAFRIQDFDGDGTLNKADLVEYLKRITRGGGLTDEEIESLANKVLEESSSDLKKETLSFNDFQRVVAPLDFQAKLLLPLL